MQNRQFAFLLSAILLGLSGCQFTSTHDHSSSAPARGQDLYRSLCIGCHAPHGTGDAFQSIPSLAGQRFVYLNQQIKRFASDERHDSKMRWAFDRAATDVSGAASDLAAYLSELPALRFADGDNQHRAQAGSGFYSPCANCHGQDAQGSQDGSIPALRAQHDSYLIHRLRQLGSANSATVSSAHALDDATIIEIAAYLSSLRGESIVR